MKTNKACPMFNEKDEEELPSVNVAMTEDEEVAIEKELLVDGEDELVQVDGTKMQLSGKLFKVSSDEHFKNWIPIPKLQIPIVIISNLYLLQHAEDVKRRSLVIKVPREAMAAAAANRKRKRTQSDSPCDYFEGRARRTNRRRMDPKVVLSNIFLGILNDLKNEPDSVEFLAPVSHRVCHETQKSRKRLNVYH